MNGLPPQQQRWKVSVFIQRKGLTKFQRRKYAAIFIDLPEFVDNDVFIRSDQTRHNPGPFVQHIRIQLLRLQQGNTAFIFDPYRANLSESLFRCGNLLLKVHPGDNAAITVKGVNEEISHEHRADDWNYHAARPAFDFVYGSHNRIESQIDSLRQQKDSN